MEENVQAAPQQTPSSNNSGSPIMKIVIISVLLGVLAGGGYLVYSFLQKPDTPQPSSGSLQTDKIISKTDAHYTGSQTITLSDSQRGGNSGNATRSIVPGNNFLAVYANLPDPEEGKFYQAWVTREENGIKAGRLYRVNPSASYSSVSNYAFEATNPPFKDFDSIYNTVIVSQETLDDNVMETKLLEGTFTQ